MVHIGILIYLLTNITISKKLNYVMKKVFSLYIYMILIGQIIMM